MNFRFDYDDHFDIEWFESDFEAYQHRRELYLDGCERLIEIFEDDDEGGVIRQLDNYIDESTENLTDEEFLQLAGRKRMTEEFEKALQEWDNGCHTKLLSDAKRITNPNMGETPYCVVIVKNRYEPMHGGNLIYVSTHSSGGGADYVLKTFNIWFLSAQLKIRKEQLQHQKPCK